MSGRFFVMEYASTLCRQREWERKPVLKDWEKMYNRIKNVPGFDEHERILFARSLSATPEERWQMNVRALKSLDLWGRSALKKFASKS